MTDEQIIKALECCCSLDTMMCEKCPYFEWIGRGCVSMSTHDAIALIKRQREEKEKILETLKNLTYDYRELEVSVKFHKAEIRAEAIREFAERMSTHIGLLEANAEGDCAEMCRFLQNATIELHAKRSAYRDVRKCMSEIVKEMTEEQK